VASKNALHLEQAVHAPFREQILVSLDAEERAMV